MKAFQFLNGVGGVIWFQTLWGVWTPCIQIGGIFLASGVEGFLLLECKENLIKLFLRVAE